MFFSKKKSIYTDYSFSTEPLKNERVIEFLHIGKCAGNQIGKLSKQINDKGAGIFINPNGHDFFLRDINKNHDYFFSIRDPLSRFYSGFYSRKRKGQPRIYSEWSEYDKFAFDIFEEATDLAEALFAPGQLGNLATAAIRSIRHTAQNQVDWFYGTGAFLYVNPPVWIIRQENFTDDFHEFLRRCGVGHLIDELQVETDPVLSHANDYSGKPPLSKKAKKNLRKWYVQDLQLYSMCEGWLAENRK